MIAFACPGCHAALMASEEKAGTPDKCHHCGRLLRIPARSSPPTSSTRSEKYVFRPGDVGRISWKLRLTRLRRGVRQAYDLMPLGSGTAGRLCAAMALASAFFVGLLVVAIATQISPVYALSLAGGVFAAILLPSAVLLLGPSDKDLEARWVMLLEDLVSARAALKPHETLREESAARAREEEERPRKDAEAKARRPPPKTRRCPYCAEVILWRALKCKHCGEWTSP
jgi:hypothetical protein